MTNPSHAQPGSVPPPPGPPEAKVVRVGDVVHLLDVNGRVWTARDIQRTPSGTHRRYVPPGDPAAFEREFTPHDPTQRERRYRFVADDDRSDALVNILRQFVAAREMER